MGIGKSSAPATPDYSGAAQATAAGNLETAKYATQANRANQYTPYGSLTWSQGTDAQGNPNNQWTQNVNLNDTGQKLLNAGNNTSLQLSGLQQGAADRVAQSTNSALPSVYDPTKSTNDATAQILSRINPQLDRQQAQMETQLTNQGLQRGTEAWNNAEKDFGYQRNDATQQAALQGINLGMNQQQQQYGQQTANRNIPLNELNAIRTGSQVTNPSFQSYGQQATTGGADLLGAAGQGYQSNLAGVNAQNAGVSNLTNGLFSLGAAAIPYMMMSDARLKTDISLAGKLDNGLNVYKYRYKSGGPMQIGVMAQEVAQVNPGAVATMPNGYMAVDYGAI